MEPVSYVPYVVQPAVPVGSALRNRNLQFEKGSLAAIRETYEPGAAIRTQAVGMGFDLVKWGLILFFGYQVLKRVRIDG